MDVVGAVTVMRVLLFLLDVCLLTECEGARMTAMSVTSPPPALCNPSVRTVVKLCTLGEFFLKR